MLKVVKWGQHRQNMISLVMHVTSKFRKTIIGMKVGQNIQDKPLGPILPMETLLFVASKQHVSIGQYKLLNVELFYLIDLLWKAEASYESTLSLPFYVFKMFHGVYLYVNQ